MSRGTSGSGAGSSVCTPCSRCGGSGSGPSSSFGGSGTWGGVAGASGLARRRRRRFQQRSRSARISSSRRWPSSSSCPRSEADHRRCSSSTRASIRSRIGLSATVLVALLFLGGPLGPRNRLEPRIRDRLPAFYGESIGALLNPLLRPLNRGELLAEPVRQPLVELVVVEVRGLVRGMLIEMGELGVVAPRKVRERALDALAVAREKLACACFVHPGRVARPGPPPRAAPLVKVPARPWPRCVPWCRLPSGFP